MLHCLEDGQCTLGKQRGVMSHCQQDFEDVSDEHKRTRRKPESHSGHRQGVKYGRTLVDGAIRSSVTRLRGLGSGTR